jgi:hypothetical protein
VSISQVHAATVTGGASYIYVRPALSMSQAAVVAEARVNAEGAGITIVPVPA